MPPYHITYFNARAKAEVMRILLRLAGQKFVDTRIDKVADWPQLKPKTQFQKLPVLEFDGKKLSQSLAGARYLAGEYGYYGNNNWERAQIDMIVYCMEDTVNPLYLCRREENPLIKEELSKRHDQQLPQDLQSLEKLLAESSGDYFMGNKLSLADIHVSHNLELLLKQKPLINMDNFPRLKALKNRVENEPKIREWREERPESEI